jgi:hypothetical protein
MLDFQYNFSDKHTFAVTDHSSIIPDDELENMKIDFMASSFIDSNSPHHSHPDYQTLVITVTRTFFNQEEDYTMTDLLYTLKSYFDEDMEFIGPCREIIQLTKNIYIYTFYSEVLEYIKTLENSGYYNNF